MNAAAAALALALSTAPASAGPPAVRPTAEPIAVPTPIVAPAPVNAPVAGPKPVGAPVTAPAPVAAPAVVLPAPATMPASAPAAGAPTAAAPAPAAPAAAPGQPGAAARPPVPAVPVQAVIDKLGQGDRAFLAGDYRTALFAYQDAIYMAPGNAAARVRLGRAYLALRYPAQALAQAELALAAEPDNEDARRLAQEARNPQPRLAPATSSAAPPRQAAAEPVASPQPRVYRFVPETEAASHAAAGPATSAGPAAAGAHAQPSEQGASATGAEPAARASASHGSKGFEGSVAAADPAQARADPAGQPAAATAPAAPEGAPGAAAAAPEPTAGQRYRTALALLANREFQKAVDELSEAIRTDPRLAVAYAARASGEFGLGRYREASDDYRTAMSLDPNLGTPLYGLAECHRVLGDAAGAAEMYQRYAESSAPDVREDLRTIAAKRAQELR